MEGNKQVGSSSLSSSSFSSSSSLTTELFGSKETTSSSGIFGSIFAPSSKVLGRESVRSEVSGRKQDSNLEAWNPKPGGEDVPFKSSEGESQSIPNRDMSSIYQEQRVEPCHLSSSIYYGGQDVYSHPQNAQGSRSRLNSEDKKDGGEDDTGSAARGNWWQGSLYY